MTEAFGQSTYASQLPGRRANVPNAASTAPYATQYQQSAGPMAKQQPYRPVPPYQTMPDYDTNQYRTNDQQQRPGPAVYPPTQYNQQTTQQAQHPQPWQDMRLLQTTQQMSQQLPPAIPRMTSTAAAQNGIQSAYHSTAPYALQTGSKLPMQAHQSVAASGSQNYTTRGPTQSGTMPAGHSAIPVATQYAVGAPGLPTSMQQPQSTSNRIPQQAESPAAATYGGAPHFGRRASPGQQTIAQANNTGMRQIDTQIQSSASVGYVPSAISKQSAGSTHLYSSNNTVSKPVFDDTPITGTGTGYRNASPSSTSSYASTRTSPHRPVSGKPLIPSGVQQGTTRPGAGTTSLQTSPSPRGQPAQPIAAAKPPHIPPQQNAPINRQNSRQRLTQRPPWDFGNDQTEAPEVPQSQHNQVQQQGTQRNSSAAQPAVTMGPPVPVNLQAVASNNRAAALAALAARSQNRANSARNTVQQTPSVQPHRDPPSTSLLPPQHRPPSQRFSNSREHTSAGQQHSSVRSNTMNRRTTSPARPASADDDVCVPIPKASYSVGVPDEEQGSIGPTIQCSTCGRRFVELAYQKHAKICEKVFVKKRKVFNTTEVRVAGTEAAKYINPKTGAPKRDSQAATGRPGTHARQISDQVVGGNNKMAKWKAQSEQLRAAMRNNKIIKDAQSRGEDITKLKFEATPEELDDRVPCHYCGRKFAPLTAERHIPKCKDTQAKPNFLKAKGGTGAYMRNK